MPRPVIIDTDPGVDDIAALLLALAAPASDLRVELISVSYGNVDVQRCLRNVVSMFAVIERERQWRRNQGRPPGFPALDTARPLVAIGATGPLGGQTRRADYFHGDDGLGGIHTTHPHIVPLEEWQRLFEDEYSKTSSAETSTSKNLFRASQRPAHVEILEVLRQHDPDTVTLVCIGPLTNLALAAAESPTTLARAKEVAVMGGCIDEPGNITPLAEFNVCADPLAAARAFALTSPIPASTMPFNRAGLPDYPLPSILGPSRLLIRLFSLDITEKHPLYRNEYRDIVEPLITQGSPLATWHAAFMEATYRTMETLHEGHQDESTFMVLHDPLCVWYVLDSARQGSGRPLSKTDTDTVCNAETRTSIATWPSSESAPGVISGADAAAAARSWQFSRPQDIRIETEGQWARGACIVDRRNRRREMEAEDLAQRLLPRKGDEGGWLSHQRGNRVSVCQSTPGPKIWPQVLYSTIFDLPLS